MQLSYNITALLQQKMQIHMAQTTLALAR